GHGSAGAGHAASWAARAACRLPRGLAEHYRRRRSSGWGGAQPERSGHHRGLRALLPVGGKLMLAATEQRVQTTRLRVTAGCAGVAVALLALRQATNPLHFALIAGFGALLAVLATWDAATMLLPNRLTYPGIVAALALCWAWPDHSWAASILGGVVGSAL